MSDEKFQRHGIIEREPGVYALCPCEWCQAVDHIDALTEQLKALRADVEALVRESTGVVGLHLNGDVATWEWLMENGWLNALAALEARDE